MDNQGSSSTGQPLDAVRHIHFVGVGGAGMRGLAHLFRAAGYQISGCDRDEKKINSLRDRYPHISLSSRHSTDHLRMNGSPDREGPAPGAVIHSQAIPEDHPELLEARKLGRPVRSYSDGLAYLFNQKRGIAVAGTHGKTTCCSLLSVILETAGFNPTCLVGGTVQNWNQNSRAGEGDYFVAEACEFRENFESMKPHHILLTNVGTDHMEHYESQERLRGAFRSFLDSQDGTGVTVWNREDAGSGEVIGSSAGRAMGISRDGEKDWWLRSVSAREKEESKERGFTVQQAGDISPVLPVPFPGPHQLTNAGMVSAMARVCGVSWENIRAGLQAYEGVKRRFELIRREPPRIIDDYGHHPEELKQTLAGARERYSECRMTLIFQPHQFSRTHYFRSEWADALSEADRIWLVPIYAARDSEEEREKIDIQDLKEEVSEHPDNDRVRLFPGPIEAGRTFREEAGKEDFLITMGAGDVWEAAREAARL